MVLIIALTAGRCLAGTWASALRIRWIRQRWSVAWKTFEAAARSPLWWSAMTSLVPRRPRSASERRKLSQKGSASDGDYHGRRDDAPGLSRFDVGGVDPQIGPFALDRAGEEGIHPHVDLLDEAAAPALGGAG